MNIDFNLNQIEPYVTHESDNGALIFGCADCMGLLIAGIQSKKAAHLDPTSIDKSTNQKINQ